MDVIVAKNLALAYIEAHWKVTDHKAIIRDNMTIETDYAWVFFYNARKFADTNDIKYAIAGNGPVFVDKDSAQIVVLGTGKPVDQSLLEYEEMRNRR